MATVITSITGLQNLTNLQNFNADYNSLATIDLSGLTNLTQVDVSDNDTLTGEGEPSLTSINVTGCTALENLYIDGSDFSAGIPDLSSLTSLTYVDMDRCGITGEVDLSASSFNNLTGFDFYGNTGITSVTLPEANLDSVNLENTALTETAVNNILQWLNGSGVENGYVNLEGGTSAIPTGNGATAKTSLQSKGWNVFTNQAPPGYVGIAASSDFDIVGDFTIEMFVNMNNNSNFPRPYSLGVYPAANAISLESGTLYFWGDNANLLSGAFNPTLGQWYHLCVTGVGNSLYILVDGVQIATGSYDGAISSQNLPVTIGYGNEPGSGFNGLISNFRWTESYVYNPAGFTVPTSPLTDLAATRLLIFQGANLNAQLTDNSGNGHNATNTGATYSALNPFTGVQGSLQMGNV
jgi:hypothetical protein